MKRHFFLLLLAFCACRASAQSPGGVAGAALWNVMDTTGPVPGLRSLLPGNSGLYSFPQGNNAVGYLNFRPGLLFSGSNQLKIDLGNQNFVSSSMFTVYHCTDTGRENSIWFITGNDSTGLVLTTNRMADLSAYKYMNYIDVIRSNPKVNTYVQQKLKDSSQVIDNIWYIGYKPVSPSLPIYPFKGLIPEIIAYSRALSGQERLQVASYLAIKYGITLTEPNATYLNSAGEQIWNGLQYSTYHKDVAGIGRDDASGLLQTIACSGNTPGLLTVSTTQSFADRTFLLWGDNGQPLTPDQKMAGIPQLLKKRWLMIAHGSTPDTTNLQLNTRQVDAPLPVNPVFWLVLDHSGKGNFTLPGTVYTRMSSLDAQGQAYFQGVTWNTNGGGKDVCAVIAAQNLLLTTTIDSPACAGPSLGSLEVRILGGDPPYRLTVMNGSSLLALRTIPDNNQTLSIPNLPTGKYWLRVTDSLQEVYTDSFYINNSDAPVPQAVAENYTLPATGILAINAGDQMPAGLSYEWSGPNNFQSDGPQVTITKAGVYALTCSKAGCSSRQDVIVTSPPANDLTNVVVYPNPSPGAYNIRITMDDPAPVNIAVYTMDGKLVSVQKDANRSNYLFSGLLESPGQYEIYLSSGLSTATKKLIILK